MPGDQYLIRNNDAIHFVTFTIVKWTALFINPNYCMIIVDSLNYCVKNKGLILFGWVIMPNHIHLLMSSQKGIFQNDIIRDLKRHTSKQLINAIKEEPEGRRDDLLRRFNFELDRYLVDSPKHNNRLWQAGYYAKECDGFQIDPQQKLDYLHRNPVRKQYVYRAEDYVFSSASAYAGGESLVELTYL